MIRVPTARLDDLLADLPRLGLVKIDVEGAEGQVLAGMNALLAAHHPHVIIEVSDRFLQAMRHSAQRLCDDFFTHGYQMYALVHDGLLRVVRWSDTLPPQFNALFVHPQRLPRPAGERVGVRGFTPVPSPQRGEA